VLVQKWDEFPMEELSPLPTHRNPKYHNSTAIRHPEHLMERSKSIQCDFWRSYQRVAACPEDLETVDRPHVTRTTYYPSVKTVIYRGSGKGWRIQYIQNVHKLPLVLKMSVPYILGHTGCFTTWGHYCRRWFPRSLWFKKFLKMDANSVRNM
jgi:hypothetical protein